MITTLLEMPKTNQWSPRKLPIASVWHCPCSHTLASISHWTHIWRNHASSDGEIDRFCCTTKTNRSGSWQLKRKWHYLVQERTGYISPQCDIGRLLKWGRQANPNATEPRYTFENEGRRSLESVYLRAGTSSDGICAIQWQHVVIVWREVHTGWSAYIFLVTWV